MTWDERIHRGETVLTDESLITGPTRRQLLSLLDVAWLEDPGYDGARNALLGYGAHVVPVSVDADGFDVDQAMRMAPRARLAYLTPARQVPLGMPLSLPRRLALLRWAAAHGSWIFEDDYDSEFRYASTPLSALQGLDDSGNCEMTPCRIERIERVVNMAGPLSDEQRQRLLAIAERCPVHRTLTGETRVVTRLGSVGSTVRLGTLNDRRK